MTDPDDAARERCTNCGRPTAAGSRNFSGRRVVAPPPGGRGVAVYLCQACQEDMHRQRKVAALSDAELRRLIEEGAIKGKVYSGRGSLRRL